MLRLGKSPEQEFIFRSSNQIYFDVSSGSEHIHISDLLCMRAVFAGMRLLVSDVLRNVIAFIKAEKNNF